MRLFQPVHPIFAFKFQSDFGKNIMLLTQAKKERMRCRSITGTFRVLQKVLTRPASFLALNKKMLSTLVVDECPIDIMLKGHSINSQSAFCRKNVSITGNIERDLRSFIQNYEHSLNPGRIGNALKSVGYEYLKVIPLNIDQAVKKRP